MSEKDLDTLFDEAFENANLIPKESVPQNVQLVLYALYKHAISSRLNAFPNYYQNSDDTGEDLRNAFKLNALMQVKNLSIDDAKLQYIDIINQLMKERGISK
ncbi:acyl-CoA-binding protein [Flavobacterium okayamense]|uniref:Acyl-CoA-binding protein n=1 Tax=Flavobacterium okayamense TaxID=2830782 RepID=A0ABM7S7C3_9FLAO|nr:acyl-CoA-binding protein [Flavobacterium okayamense]BCY29530.1 acyl-CoA-binding protein [Flavobacterium okayamense]